MKQTTIDDLADPNITRLAQPCDHAYRIWTWDAYMMPSLPPRALVGWYAICHKCKLGYQYDAGNVTRKWWQLFRWYRARGEPTWLEAQWEAWRYFVPRRNRERVEQWLFGCDKARPKG